MAVVVYTIYAVEVVLTLAFKRKARSSVHNPLSLKRIRYSKRGFSPRQGQHNTHGQTLSSNLPTVSRETSPELLHFLSYLVKQTVTQYVILRIFIPSPLETHPDILPLVATRISYMATTHNLLLKTHLVVGEDSALKQLYITF